jgi:hypothetical protein
MGVAAFVLFSGFSPPREAEAVGLGSGATVGDLAKMAASLNAGLLAGPSGPMRSGEMWDAFVGVLRDYAGYSGPIDKRTRFHCV